MAKKEELIIFSKCELVDTEHLEEIKAQFEKATGKTIALSMSAGAFIRVEEFKDLLITRIPEKAIQAAIIQENEEGYLEESDTEE
jgi:GTPase involved in cell partitioning and DNA repair